MAARLSAAQQATVPGSHIQCDGQSASTGPVFIVEIALKLSPLPLSVQRKELPGALDLLERLKQAMASDNDRTIVELSCEKSEGKRVLVIGSEIASVQVYEKSSVGSGSKRPGFSVNG